MIWAHASIVSSPAEMLRRHPGSGSSVGVGRPSFLLESSFTPFVRGFDVFGLLLEVRHEDAHQRLELLAC